ncbi:hypothetical protein [Alkalihalobacillus sp. BA299]|uniref:hypothetical protein n=1 Tax=Alkalihalobacillus sp. BA299 TaxID=2815938 RepID=UPI001ADAA3C8|nr:hypothetical protein [Alkalihalobacillus sp. BA299]
MSEWLNMNKKLLLYGPLILFLALVAVYLFLVRPLQAEERSHQKELERIHANIAHYQTENDKLIQQALTPIEKKTLLDRVPMRPNVEQIIADLERTELETGAVMDSISFSIHPNEGQEQSWKHILTDDLYHLLEAQITDMHALVSYVEMNININGKEEDVHSFVEEIVKLKRAIHVQTYHYSLGQETERLQGSVTIRAFYCEDFSKFIKSGEKFKLDYDFEPSKLNHDVEGSSDTQSPFETNPSEKH